MVWQSCRAHCFHLFYFSWQGRGELSFFFLFYFSSGRGKRRSHLLAVLWECTDTSARALCQETFCGRQERNLAQWQGLFCTLKGVTTPVTQWVEMEATVNSHAWLRKKNLWQQWFPYKKNTNKKPKHLWDGDLDFKQCKNCFCVCFHEVCVTAAQTAQLT